MFDFHYIPSARCLLPMPGAENERKARPNRTRITVRLQLAANIRLIIKQSALSSAAAAPSGADNQISSAARDAIAADIGRGRF